MASLLTVAWAFVFGQSADTAVLYPLQATIDSLEAALPGTTTREERIDILNALARLYQENNTVKTVALRYEIFDLCSAVNDSAGMAQQALAMIFPLIDLMAFDTVNALLSLCEGYYQDRDTVHYGDALVRHGFYYNRLGDFRNAIAWLLKAQHVYTSVHDDRGLANVNFFIGLIFYQLDNYPKALELYGINIRNCEERGNCFMYLDALFYSSRIFIEQGDYEEARVYLEKYVQLKTDTVDRRSRAFLHWARAMLYITQNEASRSEEEIQMALSLFQSYQVYGDVAVMYRTLGDLYRKSSPQKAIGFYEASLRTRPTMQARIRLSECLAAVGKVPEGYEQLKEYQRLYEAQDMRLEAEILEQEMANASQHYDQQLALLNSNAEIARLNELQQRMQRNALLGLSVLLLAILGLLYYQLRQGRAARKLLIAKNETIDQALHDNEDLLRETHHRVKNNLQIVSSMLHLQGRHIKDAAVLNALRDSRNRVNSMALIHQSLYREEHLKGIAMREYIQALSQSLVTSYKVDEQRISVKTRIAQLLLDVDTAIPIGLIINELLTNAIKYAFPDGTSGIIEISLVQTEETLHLTVMDNGIGLPEDLQFETHDSYGYHLIHSLARKLKADIDVRNTIGCTVSLRIKQYKILSV